MRSVHSHFLLAFLYCIAVSAQADSSFNTNGIIFPPYATGSTSWGESGNRILLQPDGKIILHGGYTTQFAYGALKETVLHRYNSDGSVDTNFGSNGQVILPSGDSQNYFSYSELQSTSKILLLQYEKNEQLRLWRLNPDGSPDTTFGTAGKLIINNLPLSNTSLIQTVHASNGKLTLLNYKLQNLQSPNVALLPIVVQLQPDYSLNTSFGDNGKFVPIPTDFFTYYHGPTDMIVQDDDSILIVLGSSEYKKIMKLTSQGQPDVSFGNSGILTLPNQIKKLIKAPGGKFLATSITQQYMTRYNADFSTDVSFGTNGSVEGYFDGIKFLENGKFLAFKNTQEYVNYTCYPTVTRYSEAGFAEASGSFVLGTLNFTTIDDLVLQPDGNILVCGSYWKANNLASQNYKNTAMYLMRMLPNLAFTPLAVKEYAVSEVGVFPNPFKNYFEVSFTITEKQSVSMDLYDSQGRIVKTIAKEECQSGPVRRQVNIPESLSSGIFFLKITSSSGWVQNFKLVKL
ncbi:MAG: T9SS type A sorting domain-containing protein [Burkholderiales bacterium]|nr:T9SS type A sorting domain-containing protein [Flavobacterium sp.]